MKNTAMRYTVLFIFLFIVLNACGSSTKLTAAWKFKPYSAGYVDSVLIVGVSDDAEVRKLFEEMFVKRFSQVGVQAISSLAVIPPEKEMDEDILKSTAAEKSMGTVLVTHLAGSGQKDVYQPGATGPSRSTRYLGRYYPSVYGATHGSGMYKKKEFVKLVNNLYET